LDPSFKILISNMLHENNLKTFLQTIRRNAFMLLVSLRP